MLDLSFNNLLRINENVFRERNLYNLQKIYLRHCRYSGAVQCSTVQCSTVQYSTVLTRVKKHVSSVMDRLTKGGNLTDTTAAPEQSPFVGEMGGATTEVAVVIITIMSN